MGKEIERKFLVKDNSYIDIFDCCYIISQGYLSEDPKRTVRVRTKGNQGFLTVKSENHGAERGEWEYEIPIVDACELLCLCKNVIEKERYICGRWEIDVFAGELKGLVVAEIELVAEDEQIELPSFIGKEVTGDRRYYNSVLSAEGAPKD